MSGYTYSDNLSPLGFISKEEILEYVTQEEVFGLVFESVPEEFTPIKSVFRDDSVPNCWFEYYTNGTLFFKDFGNSATINGVRMSHLDCFSAVMVYYNLPSFYATLKFVKDRLIVGSNKERLEKFNVEQAIEKRKEKVQIFFQPRAFDLRDGHFWRPYEITPQNLHEDKVFAVRSYQMLNTRSGSFSSICKDACYVYTDFPEYRRKLYFPYREKGRKFITTCIAEDVGGISSLAICGTQLIITKSYKDYRVLKNHGKNVVWFGSENQKPSNDTLFGLVKRFSKVIVWFDNDNTGIVFAQEVANLINSVFPGKATAFWLPERFYYRGIKDPSDYISEDKNSFKTFLTEFT